ncbi:SLC13 family permease [Desulfovibrio sp.]|uniref:SLC13 family permease n=1 Tax=Desulfovibrio sp. TaxID=885 RepID=UPI002A35861D|nr:SLC13 family permease [Desulfovibrio sp.]MDY0258854.1 sodium/proton antiporter [Desulfovibrio sp.]
MQHIFFSSFLGKSPLWYKYTVLAFLVANPVLNIMVGPFITGWLLLLQFIFILSLALKCYPIPAGGLLALEAIIIGMTTPDAVYQEVVTNLPTVLLLIFMVAGIYYLKDVVFVVFTRLFIAIRKKHWLSLAFCIASATLSAFLDALTLMAIIIAVCFNFYAIFRKVAGAFTPTNGKEAPEVEEFCGFLRNIIMHGALGTALGGTMTIVGEPQNLMIGTMMNWSFAEFFMHNAVIAVPVAIVGFTLCPLLEIFRFPGFGYQLPEAIRELIVKDAAKKARQLSDQTRFLYITQCVVGILLILALALHVAEIGLLGLTLIILLSAMTGKTKEHDFSEAFNNAMPFVCLIIVFFAILSVVHDQHLVTPLVEWVFQFQGKPQLLALYLVNGTLSFVSDNVFIASVFITEMDKAHTAGLFSSDWYEKIAVVVNMGTNIPAVATPNGQAAFLFLLTSSLAPLIKLSYMRMVKLAFPYTVTMTATGAICIYFFL